MKNLYRSDLSKAKNLGSAGSGSHHWWHQRFSAILLALFAGWVFCFSWEISRIELSGVVEVLRSPYHIIMMSLFVLTSLYHAALGMQVVIEDYISCRVMRLVLLLAIQIFSIITAFAFITAVIYIMIL